jgi:hypothetical protein
MNNASKRSIIRAVTLGFLLPILWGTLEFIFFNAHESVLTKVFFGIAYVTCPPWLLPGFWGDIGSPFLNAALYGGVAYVLSRVALVRDRKHAGQ